jgi:hypothetical protein
MISELEMQDPAETAASLIACPMEDWAAASFHCFVDAAMTKAKKLALLQPTFVALHHAVNSWGSTNTFLTVMPLAMNFSKRSSAASSHSSKVSKSSGSSVTR